MPLQHAKDTISHYEIIGKLARGHRVEFLDLYGTLEPADFTDGLHPNASGHAKLAPLVARELELLGWDLG